MPTQDRSALIPKMIVDVNGNPKKVWVRPEDLDGTKPKFKGLKDLPPVPAAPRPQNAADALKAKKGRASLDETPTERRRSAERGYGTLGLNEAAAHKYRTLFGIPINNAQQVTLGTDRAYDYLAEGLSIEQAQEFARYGIQPHAVHPKLDPEYLFVAGEKVAKMELSDQRRLDSPERRRELREIKDTARLLQEYDVDPATASRCIANGLRREHFNDKKRSVEEVVRDASKNNVDSEEFRNPDPESTTPQTPSMMRQRAERLAKAGRKWAWRRIKRSFLRTYHRIMNGIRRRVRRVLRKTFLPWEYR